jgi:predicted TIM-barrel fold metal-dependent hydrolase
LTIHGFDRIPISDVHCHPWRVADLLGLPSGSFEDRITMLGMCQITSGAEDALGAQIAQMSAETPLVLAARRHLAAHLGCRDSRESVAEARFARLSSEPGPYLTALLDEAGISSLFCDEGYPQPTVDTQHLSGEIHRPVHRVGRIEPWIKELAPHCASYQELEDRFAERVTSEANAGAVAFKTVIAYRTGLDVAEYSAQDAARAFEAWRADDYRESRAASKPVRDRLLHRLAVLCSELDRPIHLHCGGGDPDVQLTYARPSELFSFVAKHPQVPLVLIHGGWPWMEEAAYLSSIFAHVYIDVSVMLPWASLGIDQKLEIVIGTVPGGKVMYGSDEASEPEVLWLAAKYGRAALHRVLDRAVEHDWLTVEQGYRIGEGVLGANALRLHGLSV